MTIKEAYNNVLTELNKAKAPAVLLDDFIYLFNKAIQQYVNSAYNRAEYNQQASDDLKWLTKIIDLIPMKHYHDGKVQDKKDGKSDGKDHVWVDEKFGDRIYHFCLPDDYLHILNCIVDFSMDTGEYKKYCSKKSDSVGSFGVLCSRLTADLYPGILNNYYLKPSEKRPYFQIVDDNEVIPKRKSEDEEEFDKGVELGYDKKEKYMTTSNQYPIDLQVHVGNSKYPINSIMITYLRSPRYVSMQQEDLYDIDDNTQILEFPDYVCYEIINTCVKLLLENASDPRLQTNLPVNQSIAVPS